MPGIALRDLISAQPDEEPPVPAAAALGSSTKASIGFILGRDEDVAMDDDTESDEQAPRASVLPLPPAATAPVAEAAVAALSRKKKRKARICKETGCQKYVVDHGLCIRHGGGKRCSEEGCDCRAQNRGLCWKHGGYTICKIDGCTKRAKSRGICWSHGGGTRCKTDGCAKIAVSHGKCWAHGGGKRCIVDGCKRPASERTDNCCPDHFGSRTRSLLEALSQHLPSAPQGS